MKLNSKKLTDTFTEKELLNILEIAYQVLTAKKVNTFLTMQDILDIPWEEMTLLRDKLVEFMKPHRVTRSKPPC